MVSFAELPGGEGAREVFDERSDTDGTYFRGGAVAGRRLGGVSIGEDTGQAEKASDFLLQRTSIFDYIGATC
jgi:hypothetical protein